MNAQTEHASRGMTLNTLIQAYKFDTSNVILTVGVIHRTDYHDRN